MISKELLRQLVVFGCVGVFATVVHYVVAVVSVEAGGQSPYLANFFGYIVAVGVSLFGHSILTYRKRIDSQVVSRFVVVSVSAFLASEMILHGLKTYLAWSHRPAFAVVVISIPAISFVMNKFWVYANAEAR